METETIGARIARLRQEQGWTQQALAERIAISRVAVSHIELDLSVPGERTIALLAGMFKLSPGELVDGTTYPAAKAERLPDTVCCFTELERDLALLENDLAWLARLDHLPAWSHLVAEVRERWLPRLARWRRRPLPPRDREQLQAARQALLALERELAQAPDGTGP